MFAPSVTGMPMRRILAAMALGALPAIPTVASAANPVPPAGGEVSFAGCARQPDGKVVLAATVEGEADGRPRRWITLSRRDERGRPDESFGAGGTVLLQIPDGDAEAVGLALMDDGRIVVAGNAHRPALATRTDALVARFLPSGNPDRTFRERGWLVEDLGGGDDIMSAIAPDRQGGVLVAGSSLRSFWAVTSRYDFSTLRVSADGSLDARFGKSGKSFVRVGSVSEDMGKAVAAAPGDGVVLAGFSRHSSVPDFTVVRLTPSGSRDIRFGTLGWKIMRLSEKGSQATSVVLQADGKLVVGGDFIQERRSPGLKAIVVRLLPSGAFDDSFAVEGIAQLKLPGEEPASFLRVALQGDGRILAAGTATGKDGQRAILVARLLANGRADLAFGNKGAVRIPLEGKSADVRSLIAQPDGRILVCGQTEATGEPRQPPRRTGHFVLRLGTDGTVQREAASP